MQKEEKSALRVDEDLPSSINERWLSQKGWVKTGDVHNDTSRCHVFLSPPHSQLDSVLKSGNTLFVPLKGGSQFSKSRSLILTLINRRHISPDTYRWIEKAGTQQESSGNSDMPEHPQSDPTPSDYWGRIKQHRQKFKHEYHQNKAKETKSSLSSPSQTIVRGFMNQKYILTADQEDGADNLQLTVWDSIQSTPHRHTLPLENTGTIIEIVDWNLGFYISQKRSEPTVICIDHENDKEYLKVIPSELEKRGYQIEEESKESRYLFKTRRDEYIFDPIEGKLQESELEDTFKGGSHLKNLFYYSKGSGLYNRQDHFLSQTSHFPRGSYHLNEKREIFYYQSVDNEDILPFFSKKQEKINGLKKVLLETQDEHIIETRPISKIYESDHHLVYMLESGEVYLLKHHNESPQKIYQCDDGENPQVSIDVYDQFVIIYHLRGAYDSEGTQLSLHVFVQEIGGKERHFSEHLDYHQEDGYPHFSISEKQRPLIKKDAKLPYLYLSRHPYYKGTRILESFLHAPLLTDEDDNTEGYRRY